MKSKLTVNTFAAKNIKSRKKRYALMITGIILAMVFSSSILFFATSMVSSMKEMSRNSYGNCDVVLFNTDEEMMRTAYEDDIVTDYGFGHIIGYVEPLSEEETKGVSVGFLDEKAKELSYISFLEGGYPQNDGEIALEKSALVRLAPDAKVGDTIKIKFYNRNGSEISEDYGEKSYKLVGIARNKLSNIGQRYDLGSLFESVPSAFVYSGAETELGGKEGLCCYMNYSRISTPTDTTGYGRFRDYLNEKGYEREAWTDVLQNDNYLFWNTSAATTSIFAVILIGVLLIASCLGIVNTFNSNLKERKKQIGMLRTVGATKRQIITIFGREAFFISLLSAPVSVAVSYFLVKAATKLLGEDFIFVPNIWVLLLCALFSVCCVMFAALIPLVSASKVSPMASIRDTQMMRKMKTKRIKTKKSFDMPALLAKRNLIFFRGKQTVVSILLIITIVVSCYGFSFYEDFKNENYYYYSYDYSVYMARHSIYNELLNIADVETGYNENQKRDILLSPYVEKINGAQSCNVLVRTEEIPDFIRTINYFGFNQLFKPSLDEKLENINADNIDEYYGQYSDTYYEAKDRYAISENFYNIELVSLEPEILEKLENNVVSGKINIDKIMSGDEVIVYAADQIGITVETNEEGLVSGCHYLYNEDVTSDSNCIVTAQSDYKAGDKLDLSILTGDELKSEENEFPENCERKDKTVTIGAVVNELPDMFSEEFYSHHDMFLFTVNEAMSSFSEIEKYDKLNIYLNTECTPEIDNEVRSILDNINELDPNSEIYSRFEYQAENDKTGKFALISIVSIIILFLCISASIINNSLSSRIRESKREMGTLRAVGATQRDLVNSYIRQLLSIFGWGYGIGFGAFIISYVIYALAYKSMHEDSGSVPLAFSIWQTLIACLILFAVCSINLWLKIRKEMKNSIIENIREL